MVHPARYGVVKKVGLVMVCWHHKKYSCMKRLNVHPPQKPDNI
jgi:hypothetical protein